MSFQPTPLGRPQKAVSVFNFDGHGIRIHIDDEGNEWFCAKDVCDRLGITNVGNVLSGLDDDEKSSIRTMDGTSPKGGNPNMAFINEGGVWDLVIKSRKPEAKAIWHKIRHEILPQIRKTGRYVADMKKLPSV